MNQADNFVGLIFLCPTRIKSIILIKTKEVLQSQLTTFVCKSVCKTSNCLAFKPNCGDSRSRTDDPLLAKQVL